MQSFCFSRKKLVSMLPSGSLKINVSEIIQAYPFLKQIRR